MLPCPIAAHSLRGSSLTHLCHGVKQVPQQVHGLLGVLAGDGLRQLMPGGTEVLHACWCCCRRLEGCCRLREFTTQSLVTSCMSSSKAAAKVSTGTAAAAGKQQLSSCGRRGPLLYVSGHVCLSKCVLQHVQAFRACSRRPSLHAVTVNADPRKPRQYTHISRRQCPLTCRKVNAPFLAPSNDEPWP